MYNDDDNDDNKCCQQILNIDLYIASIYNDPCTII